MATKAVRRPEEFGWMQAAVAGVGITLLTATLTALSKGQQGPAAPHHAMSLALIIHLGTVLPALPLGGYLLIRRKGDRLHRLLGRVWAALMVVTAIASFWLRGNGGFSFIHLFSIATLIGVPLAVLAIMRGHLARHRAAMTRVYIGLVVAGLFAFAPGRLLYVWTFG
jgi:uncharacterized membrane protein